MFQTLVAAMIIILAALISIGVYSIVKDGHNVIAYIMLGICGICILFIFGMIVCVVSCYPAPVSASAPGVIVVAPATSATASAHAETFRGSNPIHSPLPAPRISAPPSATATARTPSASAIAPHAETFNGSNPMHPMHPMHP
jgi:hypothetical protein